MHLTSRLHLSLATAAAVVAALLVAPAAAAGAGSDRPFVREDETVPTYSYAAAVRESVRVTTPLDNDATGSSTSRRRHDSPRRWGGPQHTGLRPRPRSGP